VWYSFLPLLQDAEEAAVMNVIVVRMAEEGSELIWGSGCPPNTSASVSNMNWILNGKQNEVLSELSKVENASVLKSLFIQLPYPLWSIEPPYVTSQQSLLLSCSSYIPHPSAPPLLKFIFLILSALATNLVFCDTERKMLQIINVLRKGNANTQPLPANLFAFLWNLLPQERQELLLPHFI
jgi:hypothetical protein